MIFEPVLNPQPIIKSANRGVNDGFDWRIRSAWRCGANLEGLKKILESLGEKTTPESFNK